MIINYMQKNVLQNKPDNLHINFNIYLGQGDPCPLF